MVYEQLIEEGDLALDEIADVLEGTAARLGRSPASRPGSASQRPGSAGGAATRSPLSRRFSASATLS
jgi:hypothetical protein